MRGRERTRNLIRWSGIRLKRGLSLAMGCPHGTLPLPHPRQNDISRNGFSFFVIQERFNRCEASFQGIRNSQPQRHSRTSDTSAKLQTKSLF
ncbi:hypothetical protein NPIL_334271 [Nephila pilipes]|uniref:Uncharacterized protein n=1 Tax=Nephila pilipes TaxID=299642 RepID=A0A8X6MW93_NEPPI|nr:hypothetical protein NPIL_334271 [Nephila pilipes]